MWLFPTRAMRRPGQRVLIAMALTEHLQRDFYVSCVTLGAAVVAYLIVHRLRQPRVASSAAA